MYRKDVYVYEWVMVKSSCYNYPLQDLKYYIPDWQARSTSFSKSVYKKAAGYKETVS